uniref:N-6 DNA Methylase n=1 Tax=Promethearchaeum syntrophicum TaxID=2594042 RepID=A0A5B9DF39_9ARCH|nr:N-6 DNA methylase [Candidatus Prometheoarchaeum syntrophicum]QEE17722.1 N-6 DNA Methylase [Candidatus Prometheoarchaeum syntrophicum]
MAEHLTEKSGVALIMAWMMEISDKNKYKFGFSVESRGIDGRYPDLSIYKSKRREHYICEIEAKIPSWNAFSENLKEPARKKATKRKAPYFATTNFKQLILYNTENVNKMKPEEEQIISIFNLCDIEDLDDLNNYEDKLKKKYSEFLDLLYGIYRGTKPQPQLPLDQFLVFRLTESIRILKNFYRNFIYNEIQVSDILKSRVAQWFKEQSWVFSNTREDSEKISRQVAYLLINKIIFYNVLHSKKPEILDKFPEFKDINKFSMFKGIIQVYFDEVLKIDYETIFSGSFIDDLAYEFENEDLLFEIKHIIHLLNRYDFSKINIDIIGRIFEQLIPPKERHIFGQYFTSPDIIDLILAYTHSHEDDYILDPSCGTGTFLVRSYHYKKMMNSMLSHDDILEKIWGIDISKFPCTLSTINLAIRNLKSENNYPNIINEDFFNQKPSVEGYFDATKFKSKRAKTLGIKTKDIVVPDKFDVIVGNPPYTRQEEIENIGLDKAKLIEIVENDGGGNKIIQFPGQAGFHMYFLIHSYKFLKVQGYLGFLMINSWLDVKYGLILQEFFLTKFHVHTIIESKVERWFKDADVNTAILILQKDDTSIENKENFVRFIQIKQKLDFIFPLPGESKENQQLRKSKIENFVDSLQSHSKFYENKIFRVFPIKQKELWNLGFDEIKNKYKGISWGQFIRGPKVYFKILEKSKNLFVPLSDIADVSFGNKTGANKFFWVDKEIIKKNSLENEFWNHNSSESKTIPNYLLRSIRYLKSICVDVDEIKKYLLLIPHEKEELEGFNILNYIIKGETEEFGKGKSKKIPANTESCKGRNPWYDLGEVKEAKIFYPRRINEKFLIPYSNIPIFPSDNLFPIKPHNDSHSVLIAAYLNCSISFLFNEILCRPLTGKIKANDQDTYMIKKRLVPDFDKIETIFSKKGLEFKSKIRNLFNSLSNREMGNIYQELGWDGKKIILNDVPEDRLDLDKLILIEVLNLKLQDLIDMYKFIIDSVKSRQKKDEEVLEAKVIKSTINIENLINMIKKKIHADLIQISDFISQKEVLKTISFPKYSKSIMKRTLEGFTLELTISKAKLKIIKCSSEIEAKYLYSLSKLKLREISLLKDLTGEDISFIAKITKSISKKIKDETNFLDKTTKKTLNSKIVKEMQATINKL